MINKKTKLMALCEELATPLTQDGEFLLKGGFGTGDGVEVTVRPTNTGCQNKPCTNERCRNEGCSDVFCSNSDCENVTLDIEIITSEESGSTKEEKGLINCGFLS